MPKHYTAPETKVPYCYYEHTRDLKGFQFISLDNIDTTKKPRTLKGAYAMYFACVITESLERNPEAGEQKLRAFQEQLYRNIEKGLLENTISEFIKDKKKAEQKNSFQTTQEDMKINSFSDGKVLERKRGFEPPKSDELEKEKELKKKKELEEEKEKSDHQRYFQATRTDMNVLSPDERTARKERIKILERERIEKIKQSRTRDFSRER